MRRLSIPSRLGSALARRARGLRKFLKMTLQPEISPEPLRLGALLVQRVVRAKMLSHTVEFATFLQLGQHQVGGPAWGADTRFPHHSLIQFRRWLIVVRTQPLFISRISAI